MGSDILDLHPSGGARHVLPQEAGGQALEVLHPVADAVDGAAALGLPQAVRRRQQALELLGGLLPGVDEGTPGPMTFAMTSFRRG